MFGIASSSLAYLFARRKICKVKTVSVSFSQSSWTSNHAVDDVIIYAIRPITAIRPDMQRICIGIVSVFFFQMCDVLKQD